MSKNSEEKDNEMNMTRANSCNMAERSRRISMRMLGVPEGEKKLDRGDTMTKEIMF